MKTLSLRKAGEFDVRIKVDIFGTNAEMQVPGFDTRFTNMEIVGYDEAASQTLGDLKNIEYNFQAFVAIASQPIGVGLYVSDLNDSNGAEIELVAPTP